MSYHSGQNRRPPRVSFRWDLPKTDPGYIALLGAIKDVRAAGGQEGVDKFIDEWRRRGFIECGDETAERLKKFGIPASAQSEAKNG